MIRLLAKLLKVLNSESDPVQISLAFSLAMIAGLTPVQGIHHIFIVFVVLVMRVNLSAFLLGFAFFAGLSYLLDPLFHYLGVLVLTAGFLEGLWTSLYNTSLGRLERFYNSVVMGSLVFSLVLFFPLVVGSNAVIRRYREHVLAWVEKTKVMQFFKAGKIYQAYCAISQG